MSPSTRYVRSANRVVVSIRSRNVRSRCANTGMVAPRTSSSAISKYAPGAVSAARASIAPLLIGTQLPFVAPWPAPRDREVSFGDRRCTCRGLLRRRAPGVGCAAIRVTDAERLMDRHGVKADALVAIDERLASMGGGG